jgi:hypothetical protein
LFTVSFSSNKVVKLLPFIFIALFSGFRYEVGVDYSSYVRIFNLIVQGFDLYTEVGYEFLVNFVDYFNGTQQLVFLVLAIVTNVFIGIYIIHFSKFYFLSSVMYFCFPPFFLSTFNQIRQYFAISLFAISLIYLKDKKLINYSFIIILAALFHKSILVLFPLYFFINRKYSYKNYLLLSIGFVFSMSILEKIIKMTPYAIYLNFADKKTSITIYIFLIISLIIILFKDKIENKFKDSFIFINLSFISFLLILVTLITKDIPNMVFLRFNNYFLISYLVLIGFFYKLLKTKYQKKVYFLIVIFILILYFINNIVIEGEIYQLIPYKININLIGN